jgi:hypothetical protein
MLKVGEKKLFVYDSKGENHEMMPLCVLDFYVSETEQRKGYGKTIFDMMLIMESASPEHLAIDYPTEKSVRFLKKHYNLKNPSYQGNNYVIFEGFFNNKSAMNNKRNSKSNHDAYSSNKSPSQQYLQRTASVGTFESTSLYININPNQNILPRTNSYSKINTIVNNNSNDINQLINNQQMIQNQTQKLKLQQQQSHLELIASRNNSKHLSANNIGKNDSPASLSISSQTNSYSKKSANSGVDSASSLKSPPIPADLTKSIHVFFCK